PVMNKLLYDYQRPESNKPKVLILAPTRELVMQIGQFIDTFSRGTPLKSLVVAGGQPYPPQLRKLKYGVDILISTPGRLIDHMGSGNVKLEECHTFILDEADRMLDMGFIDDVKEVQESLKAEHQTVMFSATMNDKVRRLSREVLKDPEYVEQIRKTVVADTITHKLMNVRRKDKSDLLVQILQSENIEKALIFARTKLGADDLCDRLKEAFRDTPVRVDAIHGDKKQRTREKILMNFRKGRTKVLVATDVAARGIDVDGVSHVINYELPIEAENYVHRVGRTGRAGELGIAISFCDPSDMRLLKEIERLIKIKIDVDEDHQFHFDMSTTRDFNKGGKGKFDRNRSRGRNEGRGGSRDRGGYKGKSRDGGSSEGRSSEGRYEKKADRFNNNRTEGRSENRSEGRFEKKADRFNENRSENRSESRSDNKSENRGEKQYGKRFEKRDDSRNDNRPSNTRRPARQSEFKKPHNNASEGKRYDPWNDSQGFDDDPVLKKLRGGKPAAKKAENRADKPARKVEGRKSEGKPDFKKKVSGDDVQVTFKKKEDYKGKSKKKSASKGKPKAKKTFNKPKGNAAANDKDQVKQTGGHKSFSPQRKTLRPSRAS
ncbi:MAG: DEAD/DEAH box helicase, partial [Kordiimonadaceae bacterium]|nr:DEAD/DEAH box helicase [Kordiimonadaceae bacterium]